MSKTLLVTGSSGLIGSEVCVYFARELGYTVHGVDNNQRAVFFGPQGDTRWNQQRLCAANCRASSTTSSISATAPASSALVKSIAPDVVVHTAAQPSHDRAAAIPFDDFDTNAVGTLNLLEAVRQAAPETPFVHMSTNKVYGDAPEPHRAAWNSRRAGIMPTRPYANGIAETFTIDQSKHSLFGASKVAADVMVQEYGRYFSLPTCCLRGGCLTGPNHSGVELHGFLSYLVKCNLEGREYKVFGYKGKQVRDNIHSLDVARFMAAFVAAPRAGEVYNLGGGKANSTSILEAFAITEKFTGKAQVYTYLDENRIGDHICYYSDLRKMRSHYPTWDITQSLEETIRQIVAAWQQRPKVLAAVV